MNSTDENGKNGSVTGRGSISRRGFLGLGAIAGVTAMGAGLTGCAPKSTSEAAQEKADSISKYSFEVEPAAISESKIADTFQFDVVVVGAGAAGLCAAASAAESGAATVCIEKNPKSQGAGTYYGFINTKLQNENGVATVDETSYEKSLIEANLGATSPSLMHAYVQNSAKVGDWLCDMAALTGNKAMFSNEMGSVNTLYFDDEASGSTAYGMLASYGAQKGAEYVYDTEVVRIERDSDGRVSGILAKTGKDSYARYNASKGVVLATGGYNGDHDMIAKYIPWVDVDTSSEYSPIFRTGNTGDGLKMALWSGARIGAVPHTPMIHFLKGSMPTSGSLFVNGAGERFADEGTSMEVMAQIIMRQPGHTMYNIADSKPSGMALLMMSMSSGTADASSASSADAASGADAATAASGADASSAAATGGDASGDAESGGSGPMSNLVSNSGPTYQTIEELAEANGFDADTLKATVARWNELAAQKHDADFGSDFSLAQTIDTPPYSCTESPGCRLAMIGGPQINQKMEVVDDDYAPIEGLYATGNCASGFFGPNYPMQVQSGIARAFCSVSGYLAAKNALS